MRRKFLPGSVFVILVFALIQIQMVDAKELFYNSLDSKEAIEASGGKLLGGSFEPAKYGNGLLTDEAKEVAWFPTEGNIKLEQGTVTLWIKVMVPILGHKTEALIFMVYPGGVNAFMLVHGGGFSGKIAYRIKDAGGTWHNATSKDLAWKKGEIHHVAGTWGNKGIKLYLDGKLAGEEPFKGGPAILDKKMWIGGSNLDVWPDDVLPSMMNQDELRIFDEQLDESGIQESMKFGAAIAELFKTLATTWGKVKGRVLR